MSGKQGNWMRIVSGGGDVYVTVFGIMDQLEEPPHLSVLHRLSIDKMYFYALFSLLFSPLFPSKNLSNTFRIQASTSLTFRSGLGSVFAYPVFAGLDLLSQIAARGLLSSRQFEICSNIFFLLCDARNANVTSECSVTQFTVEQLFSLAVLTECFFTDVRYTIIIFNQAEWV